MEKKGYPWLVVNGFVKLVLFCVLFFILAGRLDYWQGWVFIVFFLLLFVVMVIFFSKEPGLVEERLSPGPGTKGWDKVFWAFYLPLSISVFVVAILDSGRFYWTSPLPIYVYVISYVVLTFSTFVLLWCMWVNKFFSSVVRIQKERKQLTVTAGPYSLVRHPGYAVAIPMYISMGLALGSFYALIPSTIVLVLLMIRTCLEDNTLKKELKGYKEYARKVRYRILPGVW